MENMQREVIERLDVSIPIPSLESSSDSQNSWTDYESSDESDWIGDMLKEGGQGDWGNEPYLSDANGPEMRQKYEEFRKEQRTFPGNDFQFNEYMENVVMDCEGRGGGGDVTYVSSTTSERGVDDEGSSDRSELSDDGGGSIVEDLKGSTPSDDSSDSDHDAEGYPNWFQTSFNSFIHLLRTSFRKISIR